MTAVEIVGWAAAFVGTVLGLPQVVRLARTQNVEGLSLPFWQLILALNIAWTSHGIILVKANLIVPNVFGLASTLAILVMMARELGRPLGRVFLPGVLIAAAMIAVDLVLGTAAYGMVAMWPALIANAGQTLELVRSPRVTGVSPVFLIGGVLNQALWLGWGLLVPDVGTQIAATSTLAITGINLLWWALRKLGLRSFGVPTRDEVRAHLRARRAELQERRAEARARR
ncbi:MAG: hypothetical protein J0I14_17200 [Propionibacteriaceae bacterium]|nr:hypothetical protein [Propionibacteriaceae bacterium]